MDVVTQARESPGRSDCTAHPPQVVKGGREGKF